MFKSTGGEKDLRRYFNISGRELSEVLVVSLVLGLQRGFNFHSLGLVSLDLRANSSFAKFTYVQAATMDTIMYCALI